MAIVGAVIYILTAAVYVLGAIAALAVMVIGFSIGKHRAGAGRLSILDDACLAGIAFLIALVFDRGLAMKNALPAWAVSHLPYGLLIALVIGFFLLGFALGRLARRRGVRG